MTTQSTLRFNYFALAPAALLAILLPCRSHAALGEAEATAAADAQQLRGSLKSMQHATTHRVHEIALPSGTVLREFAGSDGTIFAVAWSGPGLPDLRQALGRYFDVYVGAQKVKRGRGHFEVQQAGMVLQSHGHMRAFAGRAYLPKNLPAGLSLDEVR